MAGFSKVYAITNENLRSYQQIYNFSNARVLTVLGSGDQYLAALLYGAKEIDVFDINFLTWYYFYLKITAIKALTHEEFFHFFIESELSDIEIYLKIRENLTNVFRNYFDLFIKNNGSIKKLCHKNETYSGPKSLDDNSIIPYYRKDEYYKLRTLLNNNSLPRFYKTSITNLQKYICGQYDLMLFSNIYSYLYQSVNDYKKLLDSFDYGIIQANYLWNESDDISDFISNGFIKNLVPPVNPSDLVRNNVVLSLKR